MRSIFWLNEGKRMEKTSHSTTVDNLPKSWETKILTRLRDGGIHLVSGKGHGKSNVRCALLDTFPRGKTQTL